MKETKQYYSSGEFAKRAHVTLRAIRYYDQKNLLKPSYRTSSGARLYTDADLVRLQQILLWKYLGFSLEDIREMTLAYEDRHFMIESLKIQKKLIKERIDEMQAMEEAIDSTSEAIRDHREIDWNGMLNLIHMTAMERSLKSQYLDAANITARIELHSEFSVNPEGWFPFIYRLAGIKKDMNILEIGCGNGALWTMNTERLPERVSVCLSDISEGMVHDVKNRLGNDSRFSFNVFDCHTIPYAEEQFDLVIANHLLFYCEDPRQVLQECRRVLKPAGKLMAATYGSHHMQEVTTLVRAFNPEIALASESLDESFGLENGREILSAFFKDVELVRYDDAIVIKEAEPLIAYILSCHGNQNHLLLDRYKEFKDFVVEHTKDGFHITKDAGVFICTKSRTKDENP